MKTFTAAQLNGALSLLFFVESLSEAEQREILANDYGVDAHGFNLLRRLRAYEIATGEMLEFEDK